MAEADLLNRLAWVVERLRDHSFPLEAGTVQEALDELNDRRAAELDRVVENSTEPETFETYPYWITYQWSDKDLLGRRVAGGTGTYALTRSTPILTFEDIRSVAEEIRTAPDRQHGGVSLRSFTLMKG